MEIRPANAADEIDVCRLWTMLLKFYNAQASPEVLRRSFHFCINNPHKVLVFIILNEGVVTGTASLHMGHYSTWNDNYYGHIEDVIIDPQYRARGLAYHLLQHIIDAAREHNLSRLELNTLNGNHGARKLYEKLGFTTDSVSYSLSLH